MVRRLNTKSGNAWLADGIDKTGRRKRLRFPSKQRAEEYEGDALAHGDKLTINYLFQKWIPECWPPDVTRDSNHRNRVRELIELIGRDVSIHDISRHTIEDVRQALMAQGNKLNTVANKLSTLSRLLRHAVEVEKIIDAAPHVRLERDKMGMRTFVLTPEQEDALIAGLPPRWQPFAVFLLDTASRGFRECSALRWQDVDWNGMSISFWHNKTDKPRTVALTQDAVAVLRANKDAGYERPWSILGTHGYSRRMWLQYWHKARDKAGLPKGEVVPYTLRHTRATRLAQSGMQDLKLADYMGHTNLATTRRYTHTNVEDQRQFVSKLERKRTYTAHNNGGAK